MKTNDKVRFLLNGTKTEMTVNEAQQLFIKTLHQEDESWVDFPVKPANASIKDFYQFWRCYNKTEETNLVSVKDLENIRDKDIQASLGENKISYYVSVNGFSGEIKKNKSGYPSRSRSESNCTNINGVFLDFDLHGLANDKVDDTVAKILDYIEINVANNRILKPSIINYTGRGIAMFYLYDQSSFEFNTDFISFHKKLAGKLMTFFDNIIPFDEVEIDKSTITPTKICRIPFTYNTSSESYSSIYCINEIAYDPKYIYEYFNLDEIDTSNTFRKKKTKKKEKATKKIETNIYNKFDDKVIYNLLKLDEEKYYYIPSITKAVIRSRLAILDKFIEDEGIDFVEGSGRNNLIYLYYAYSIAANGHNLGLIKTIEFNKQLGEPLLSDEFIGIIRNIDNESNHLCEKVIKKTETFIKYVGFSKEEIETYGIYKNQQKVANQKKQHEIRVIRDKLICEIALAFPNMTYNEIRKYLRTNYSINICRKTVERRLNKHGINETTRSIIRYEDIDFKKNEIYKHKKNLNSSNSSITFSNLLDEFKKNK